MTYSRFLKKKCIFTSFANDDMSLEGTFNLLLESSITQKGIFYIQNKKKPLKKCVSVTFQTNYWFNSQCKKNFVIFSACSNNNNNNKSAIHDVGEC